MASKFSHDELILFFLPANDFIDNSIKYSKILFENRYRPYYKNSSEGFVVVYPEESEPSENFPSSINRNKNSIKRLLNSFTYSSNIYREVKNKSFSKNNGYFYEDIESINGSIWSLKNYWK